MRLDQHGADLEDLRARMWYHDLSERESDEEIQRILARAEGRDTGVESHPGIEYRSNSRERRRPRMIAPQRRTSRMMQGRATRILQPSDDAQMPDAYEDDVQQRLQKLTTSQRQHADTLTQLHSRLDHSRLEIEKPWQIQQHLVR